eukprot:3299205-Pleurochrysis_carterae.AAC.2
MDGGRKREQKDDSVSHLSANSISMQGKSTRTCLSVCFFFVMSISSSLDILTSMLARPPNCCCHPLQRCRLFACHNFARSISLDRQQFVSLDRASEYNVDAFARTVPTKPRGKGQSHRGDRATLGERSAPR